MRNLRTCFSQLELLKLAAHAYIPTGPNPRTAEAQKLDFYFTAFRVYDCKMIILPGAFISENDLVFDGDLLPRGNCQR